MQCPDECFYMLINKHETRRRFQKKLALPVLFRDLFQFELIDRSVAEEARVEN